MPAHTMERLGCGREDRGVIAKPAGHPVVFVLAAGSGEECFPEIGVLNVQFIRGDADDGTCLICALNSVV